MIVLKCPVCDVDVEVKGTVREGKYIDCDSCGSLVQLQRIKTGDWILNQFEEELEEKEELKTYEKREKK